MARKVTPENLQYIKEQISAWRSVTSLAQELWLQKQIIHYHLKKDSFYIRKISAIKKNTLIQALIKLDKNFFEDDNYQFLKNLWFVFMETNGSYLTQESVVALLNLNTLIELSKLFELNIDTTNWITTIYINN